ncbi:hypothetical protein BGX23_011747 [Mortierella sp. AD031]|nr:hypothetical protein BGX23_011747 [Mortierella sp. AD031]
MGKIDIKCLTADPGLTTLYGFAYGFTSRKAQETGIKDEMILFKSQENPSEVADIKWSAVSTFPTSTEMTGMITRQNADFACAVNSAGVFTAISNSYWRNDEKFKDRMQGIRYNPAGQMEPEYKVTGDGVWSALEVASNFNQTRTLWDYNQKLFYVTEDDGKETLFHAHVDNPSVIRIGIVNETGGRSLLQHLTTYTNDTLKIGTLPTLTYSNNQLYAYSPGSNPIMLAIPLSSGTSSPTPPAIKRIKFSGTDTTGCRISQMDSLKSAIWKESFILLCMRPGYESRLETFNLGLQDTALVPVTKYPWRLDGATSLSSFQPIGGQFPGQPAFGVVSSPYGIQGITLTGPSIGSLQAFTEIWIEGVYGDGDSSSGNNNNKGVDLDNSADIQSSSGMSYAAQVAIAASVGVVFVIATVFGIFLHLNKNM